MNKIFMTGASGTVASLIRPHFYRPGDTWTDIRPAAGVLMLPLDDPGSVARAMCGCDTVVHAVGAGWKKADAEIEASMIPPLACVLEAMGIANVRRIVLLSSMHVVADYPLGYPITPSCPPKTSSFYGKMHVQREKMVKQSGLDACIVRIGVVATAPRGTRRDRAIWISPRDVTLCIDHAIQVAGPSCPILWGCSAENEDHAWIHSDGRAPTMDNAADYPLTEPDRWRFVGGPLSGAAV